MKVAFYAPLKAPDHPVPSGDRQLARALLQALRAAGHQPFVASRFRSFDARGDARRQARLRKLGEGLVQRLIAHFRNSGVRPDVWFTYHLFHKAPDWLGPAASRALGIPYVIAEASIAKKQQDGPWALGHTAAVDAVRAADAILLLNPIDIVGVRDVPGVTPITNLLPPFMNLAAFADAAAAVDRAVPRNSKALQLITVAMMREGAKLASYCLLANALKRIVSLDWVLVVVGDGPVRAQVEAAFVGIEAHRVRFVGALTSAAIARRLRASDLFVWPAIDEAFGMAFIEAQACGVPVVGGNSNGVSAVVADGRSGVLVPPGDADAFAAAIRHLLQNPGTRKRMAREAAAYVRAHHDLPTAAAHLDATLRRVANLRTATAANANAIGSAA